MRFTSIRDRANFLRWLKPLEAHGYVRQVVVMAKPAPEMREPLYVAAKSPLRELSIGDIRQVLGVARARWSGLSAVPQRCVVATQCGCGLFGVRSTGPFRKRLQISHDLAVAEAAITRMPQLAETEHWYGEDFANFRLGDKAPDAVIFDAQDPAKVIEIVGADYDQAKLIEIQKECNARGLSYELW